MIALLMALAAASQPARPPQAIWRSSCGYCHDDSKVGPPIPRYEDGTGLKTIVRGGTGGAMPPFHRSEISDVELDGLARWLGKGRPAK